MANGNVLMIGVFCLSLLGGAGGATAYVHTIFATKAEVREIRDMLKDIWEQMMRRPYTSQTPGKPRKSGYVHQDINGCHQWTEPTLRIDPPRRYRLCA